MFRRACVVIGLIVVATAVGWPAAVAAPSSPASSPTPTSTSTTPVTVVWDDACENYGADVTNHDTVVHTETLVVDGAQVGTPVEIPPGETRHVPLPVSTPAGSTVQILDNGGAPIVDTVVRFCVTTDNESVTIKANTSYTLTTGVSPRPADPEPQHGSLTVQEHSLRYTPDPCFSGTDRFGFNDPISATHGVITVHVLPGPCKVTVKRSATNCTKQTVTDSATNPYSLPVTVVVEGPNGPGDTDAVTVPAHSTRAVLNLGISSPDAVADKYRFIVEGIDVGHDTVRFPCPPPSGSGASGGSGSTPNTSGQSGLAATGSSVQPVAIGGAVLVLLGTGLTVAGARRRYRLL